MATNQYKTFDSTQLQSLVQYIFAKIKTSELTETTQTIVLTTRAANAWQSGKVDADSLNKWSKLAINKEVLGTLKTSSGGKVTDIIFPLGLIFKIVI